jgi:hypothetical protein
LEAFGTTGRAVNGTDGSCDPPPPSPIMQIVFPSPERVLHVALTGAALDQPYEDVLSDVLRASGSHGGLVGDALHLCRASGPLGPETVDAYERAERILGTARTLCVRVA